jgi:hypothetical protein
MGRENPFTGGRRHRGMEQIIIRYKTKPEATQQNTELIENVFRELAAAKPEGVGYAVLRTDDGTFFHIATFESDETNAKLTSLPAFEAFQKDGQSRRIAPPERNTITVVGNYRVLAK